MNQVANPRALWHFVTINATTNPPRAFLVVIQTRFVSTSSKISPRLVSLFSPSPLHRHDNRHNSSFLARTAPLRFNRGLETGGVGTVRDIRAFANSVPSLNDTAESTRRTAHPEKETTFPASFSRQQQHTSWKCPHNALLRDVYRSLYLRM